MASAPSSDHGSNRRGRFIRKKVCNPYDRGAASGIGESLRRCIMMRERLTDCRPDNAVLIFIDSDDFLEHHHAVAERYRTGAGFHACIDHKPRHKTRVKSANVAEGVPHVC